MGRDLAPARGDLGRPHLYVWGWQSPLYFYSRLDSPTRHFFVDNLLRDQAGRDHPLIGPRVAEIMATLRGRPPELIFAGYPPFPACARSCPDRYLPSDRRGAPDSGSAAISSGGSRRPGRRGRSGPASPVGSADRTGRVRLGLDLRRWIALAEPAHDRVPALAQGVRRAALGHPAASSGRSTRREQCVGQPLGGIGGLDEEPGLARPDGLPHAAGPEGDDRQPRGHRLEHDVAEGLGQAREGEEVGRGVMVGEVVARFGSRRTGPPARAGAPGRPGTGRRRP